VRSNEKRTTKLTFGIGLLALLFALGTLAEAQQPKTIHRIGYQSAGTSAEREEAFRQGLRELGYIEGQNIIIEWRFAQGKLDQVPRNSADLVRLKVDVIVTGGPTDTRAAKAATSTIPIVMTSDSDPVETGTVASLSRPGGNITGLADLNTELTGKRLELLKETLPRLSHVVALLGRRSQGSVMRKKETEIAARSLGLQVQFP
jgi:putative ABC transport system substrate-binding protein